jgi:hypothetical protein
MAQESLVCECGNPLGDEDFREKFFKTCASCLQPMADALAEGLDLCKGEASGEGYHVAFSGACPVQGQGEIHNFPVYYRARHDHVSVEFFPMNAKMGDPRKWPDPIFAYSTEDSDASWLPKEKSQQYIAEAAEQFRTFLETGR